MEKLLLSPEEAAKVLSCGRSFLFKLIENGEIESIKVGRLRRITPASLDKYVERKVIENQKERFGEAGGAA